MVWASTVTQCLPSPRLFKLKKRYRNVLDTMFELLPRMARSALPRSSVLLTLKYLWVGRVAASAS